MTNDELNNSMQWSHPSKAIKYVANQE